MPPLAVPSSFVRDDPGDPCGFGEEPRLGESVLACCRVHDQERLVGGAGHQLLRGPAHLVELFHQVSLGVQAACGVDDEDLCSTGFSGGAGVVERG